MYNQKFRGIVMERLIFLEGVPGVGKSTTSIQLRDRINGFGFSSECYLEADINNPIDLYWYAYVEKHEYDNLLKANAAFADEITLNTVTEDNYYLVRYQDFDKKYYSPELYTYLKEREVCYRAENPISFGMFSAIFINRWRGFLASPAMKNDYAIFDGSLIAHQANDIIRNYNASDEMLISYFSTICKLIAPYKPLAFYLESDDIWERIYEASVSRCSSIPPKEQVAFWENRKRVDLMILESLPIESHRFNITGSKWASAVDAMLTYVLKCNAFQGKTESI
jgi:hypothetical protein